MLGYVVYVYKSRHGSAVSLCLLNVTILNCDSPTQQFTELIIMLACDPNIIVKAKDAWGNSPTHSTVA